MNNNEKKSSIEVLGPEDFAKKKASVEDWGFGAETPVTPEPPEPPEKKSGKKFIIIAIVVLLLLLLAIAAVFGLSKINSGKAETTEPETTVAAQEEAGEDFSIEAVIIEVPELEGKTLAEAKELLEKNNISYEVFEEYSDSVEKDAVIAQSIESGSEITEDALIYITVSLGKEEKPADSNNKPAVTEKKIALEYVVMSPSAPSLYPGKSVKINVTAFPENATEKEYMLIPDDYLVISVGADNTIKALAPGKSAVTAYSKDGKVLGSITVTVKEPEPKAPATKAPETKPAATRPVTEYVALTTQAPKTTKAPVVKYKITFEPNGGTVSEVSRYVEKDGKYGTLPIPTRSGFTFDGWYTEGGAKVTASTELAYNKDHSLVAKWKEKAYTVSWNNCTGCDITVTRTSSPAGASTGNLSSGSDVFHGDVLSVTYSPLAGYSITSKGSSNITVSGNIDSNTIYAQTTLKEYTYDIVYKSSNGTNLGSSTIKNKHGVTTTVSAPAKKGYDTPASQTVTWDKESKTITFIYNPSKVSPTVKTGRVDDNVTEQYYKVTIEYKNRKSDSVQVRLVYEQTIKKPYFSEYEYLVRLTAGGKSNEKVVVPFGTWKRANGTDTDRTRSVKTEWITISGISPSTQTVDVKVYQWMENFNGTDMGDGVNISFKANIPVY
ncbi:MAG: InlB B-repeat-containing protein [Clostridia bacterium]|nr:InlB B-repeat-containing protein [Clostridia bacterium]